MRNLHAAMNGVLTLKSLKFSNGLDTVACSATLLFNGQKAFDYVDEGNGGETFITKEYPAFKNFKGWVMDDKIRGLILEEWPFMETIEKIDFQTCVECITSELETLIEEAKERAKALKKVEKKMEDYFILANPLTYPFEYRFMGYNRPLDKIPAHQRQEVINVVKSKLKKGEEIMNTNIDHWGIRL